MHRRYTGFIAGIALLLAAPTLQAQDGVEMTRVVIDEGQATDRDERQIHAAWVGFRPADGQAVEVNPPRFSWPYEPGIVRPDGFEGEHSFTLQIARSAHFTEDTLLFETVTPLNFFNAIPPLEGGRYKFWRVGWDVGTDDEQWSETRCFIVEPGTPEWDRSGIANLADQLRPHPRIGVTEEGLQQIRALRETDEDSARLFDGVVSAADSYMEQDWFSEMPEIDELVPQEEQNTAEWPCTAYRDVATKMRVIAMAYLLTGDESYLRVREPLMTLASYPPGGESSPEGLGPRRKWATRVTMDLGLVYDWLYPVLTEDQRAAIAESLDWRIAHILDGFSWRRGGNVLHRGLAGMVGSHQWENAQWTLVGALAVWEDSEAAREFAPLMLNYLCGVTNGFGETEAWNEGVLYGNAKCATLLDAACWTAMAVPDLHIERNPYWSRIGSFFAYLTPLGIERSAWGNYGRDAGSHLSGHKRNFRRLAFLTGRGSFLQNWQSANQIHGTKANIWQEYFLPHYYELPEPEYEDANQALFNTAGWAMAFSGPPSDPATYRDGVGLTFHCRPRGGYSHSFNNENAFEAFTYGSVIATGGGRKANGDRHADSTMSHNATLIDGRGQNFSQFDPETETAGRIIAWHEQPGLVYWCGDATEAYRPNVPQVERALRHVLFVSDSETDGYFITFDDLAVADDADPVRFSWLYHVHQDVPVELDESAASFSYTVGEANVRVRHLLDAGDLELQNLRGEDGYKNPITGEDMLQTARGSVESSPLRQFKGEPVWNNLWVTGEPRREWQFLAAITPWREGAPEPAVEQLGERHFAVETEAGRRTILFGSPDEGDAEVVVDFERIRMLAGPQTPPEAGETLWEADLSDTAGWVLDGEGAFETLEGGVLKINTDVRTTLWAPETFAEPVLFDFEARTDDE
ncbi:MAG: DUF4962 domain-containing protein, partial [Armatimonadota bacterium]